MTKPPRERATEENFEEELYLRANPDVARHVANGARIIPGARRVPT